MDARVSTRRRTCLQGDFCQFVIPSVTSQRVTSSHAHVRESLLAESIIKCHQYQLFLSSLHALWKFRWPSVVLWDVPTPATDWKVTWTTAVDERTEEPASSPLARQQFKAWFRRKFNIRRRRRNFLLWAFYAPDVTVWRFVSKATNIQHSLVLEGSLLWGGDPVRSALSTEVWTNSAELLHRKKKNTCSVFSGGPAGAVRLKVRGESGRRTDACIDLPGLFPSSEREKTEEMKQMMSHRGKWRQTNRGGSVSRCRGEEKVCGWTQSDDVEVISARYMYYL